MLARWKIAIALSVLLAVPIHRARADRPWFTGIGDLKGGASISFAEAISDDGTTVVGTGTSSGNWPNETFRWTRDGGMQGLGDLNGGKVINSGAFGVSADGRYVVGGSESDNTEYGEAFLWSADGGMVGLGDLPGGDYYSAAYGVSEDGSVVVGGSATERSHGYEEGFRWTRNGGMKALGDYPDGGFARVANATSRDGQIASGWGGGKYGAEAYYHTESEGIVGIGGLYRYGDSRANGMSGNGAFIVGDAAFKDENGLGTEAFIWSEETGIRGLGWLTKTGHRKSVAIDVSDAGDVVVGWQDFGVDVAWIWDEAQGMRQMKKFLADELGIDDAKKWELHWPRGISADGRTITGIGINPRGAYEGWVVHIPEPTTGIIIVAAIPFIRRWRALGGR